VDQERKTVGKVNYGRGIGKLTLTGQIRTGGKGGPVGESLRKKGSKGTDSAGTGGRYVRTNERSEEQDFFLNGCSGSCSWTWAKS